MRWQAIKEQITRRISSLAGMGCICVLVSTLLFSCAEEKKGAHQPATPQSHVHPDSMPSLHSVGVSSLISDSGVIRYHIVAEEWDIHTPNNQAPTWKFKKGLLMLRLDTDLSVDLYVQADTAYLHRQNLWELRGRVRIRNLEGTKFNTEELFWDLDKHEIWNHAHMTIITPERTLHGTEFKSNEKMTRYSVMNSSGDFPMEEQEQEDSIATDSTASHAVNVAKPGQRASGNTKTMEPAPTKYDFLKEENPNK